MVFIDQLKLKYRLLLNYLGVVMMVNGLILIMPLIMLPFYKDEVNQAKFFLIPAAVVALFGSILWILNKKVGSQVALSIHEGGIIVVLSWIITCVISAIPFVLEGTLNFTQAMFEAVSGWTTTGLSVVDVTATSHVFLFWRSVMQLFGGAGIAVIVLAAIIGPSGRGLYSAEGRSDLLLPNITKSAKLIMTIYLGYIFAGIALYSFAGMPFFDAINHSIAALSTGGFSTVPSSIGEYNSIAIEFITLILMLAGTINFAAHYILLKGDFKRFIRLGEIKIMFFLLSIFIPLVSFFSLNGLYTNVSKVIRVGLFELISALSTTGFSTVSYTDWNDFGIFIMILLMLVGGGTGSTAGGIKQYRIYVLYKSLLENIKGFVKPPKRIKEIEVNRPDGKAFLDNEHVTDVSNFVFIYMVIYFIGVMILMLHGYPLKESMFEFASSLGTVGLSVGITSASAPAAVLWTETVGMFLGRLEILVIIYALTKVIKDIKAIRSKKR